MRHGLTAKTVIAGLEDADDYQAFEATITADYEAETAVERELVLRLASVLWRLRRATYDSKTGIAGGFLCLAALPTFPLDRRSRYEHLLWRQAHQLVITLESLRRRQRAPNRSTYPFSFQRREPGALSEEFR